MNVFVTNRGNTPLTVGYDGVLYDFKKDVPIEISVAGARRLFGYGLKDREDILVLRNIDGTMTKERIDLTKADFINSPYFYLKQNDVIVVSPNETKQKTSRLDPNAGIYISVASIVVTILALIFKN